ncbi:MAG: hypothetical protein ACRC38_04600 [Plesiomonas sp.]
MSQFLKLISIFSIVVTFSLQAIETERLQGDLPPVGCIISTETGQSYCLKVGERSEYSLPDWIVGQSVYVNAAPGTKVLLSDYDNLSYNRIGEFVGTVENENLKNVTAWNGETISFDRPRSMRVTDTSQKVSCIVVEKTKEKYCLPAGSRSGYSLPSWILGKTVYVDAAPGTQVLLSDWDNLSYNRVAAFSGKVYPYALRSVRAWDKTFIDFDKPRSMRVTQDNRKYDFLFPFGITEYTAGTTVLSTGTNKVYKCKAAPSDKYCRQSDAEPGIGNLWEYGWIEVR